MKIRIKGNSLRYRLTRTDIDRFTVAGYLEEQIHFGGGTLTYALKSDAVDELSASFNNNKITLYMPAFMVHEWDQPDRIGFENNNAGLYLLVEKDFKCLDNVAEDQSDNFPNPLSKNSIT